MNYDVIVIGAGAAGLLAAARAAERGRQVLLLEKNNKAGVKILMSGGTRCNLTHAVDKWGIIDAFGNQGSFLHSALAALGPSDLVQMFEAEGVKTKVEVTGKIFPASDKATDVLAALLRRLRRSGATMQLNEPVTNVARANESFVVATQREIYSVEKVIITSGGQSYPGCGTTGDGYAWAKILGHTIVATRAALVPVTTHAQWVRDLKGVTVPDVAVSVIEADAAKDKIDKPRRSILDNRRGSFLFTHFGLSGPSVLDVSRAVTSHPRPRSLELVCDFLPHLPQEELTARLQTECSASGKKQVAVIIANWLPRRLAETLIYLSGIPMDRRGAELSKSERTALVHSIKQTRLSVSGTLGFKKAEVTAGGVSLEEIDSRTMQSKLMPNLYLAGEILDLDGPIGGYNFQSAFSTGWLAGESA